MKLRLLVEKLYLRKEKFILKDELKRYCKQLNQDYYATISYLLSKEYLIRIMRGIFYIKSVEERKLKKTDISYYEAIEKALGFKGVKNWYFGLESALKLNNLTHEYYTIDYVINDKIFRPKPFIILSHNIKFVKLAPRLCKFGIIKKTIQHSDVEKTILDFIYLGKYNHLSDPEVMSRISPLLGKCSKNRLIKYSKYYNKTTEEFVRGLL